MSPRKKAEADEGMWGNHAGCHGHCCCGKHRMGGLLFGIFILLIGVSWLGNDMHWWSFNLPWLPLALVLVGIAILAKWKMKRENCEH